MWKNTRCKIATRWFYAKRSCKMFPLHLLAPLHNMLCGSARTSHPKGAGPNQPGRWQSLLLKRGWAETSLR